jgi:tetratricopeptide (TPR) repeat protein
MELYQKLREIRALSAEAKHDHAINRCNFLLEQYRSKVDKAEVLRLRAEVYEQRQKYDQAIVDRELIFTLGEGTIRDYYKAAECAVYRGEYGRARLWTMTALRLGADLSETWFVPACYFLLAYISMQTGHYQDAIANLNRAASADVAATVPLRGLPHLYSYPQLRQEIERRASLVGQQESRSWAGVPNLGTCPT